MSIIHCEQERNIAIELEQKMMEDFEWKLREVEGGYKTKIKSLEEGLESKVSERKIVFMVFNTDLYRSITTRGRSRARKTRSWRRCASTRAETWRRSWRRSGTVRRLLLRLLLQGELWHLASLKVLRARRVILGIKKKPLENIHLVFGILRIFTCLPGTRRRHSLSSQWPRRGKPGCRLAFVAVWPEYQLVNTLPVAFTTNRFLVKRIHTHLDFHIIRDGCCKVTQDVCQPKNSTI